MFSLPDSFCILFFLIRSVYGLNGTDQHNVVMQLCLHDKLLNPRFTLSFAFALVLKTKIFCVAPYCVTRHTISIWLVILTSQGFAFIYMEDERDAEDAIRRLDRIEFGRKGRWICVEWTKVLQVFEHFIEMLSLFCFFPLHFDKIFVMISVI